MKYKNLIEAKFNKFKLTPRNNQVSLINEILSAYIDDDKKYVVLSSPTGTGKSIIAVIVSECLYDITNSSNIKKSHILMQSNVLVDQYHKTFSKYNDFIQVKGASNYNCAALNTTADNCIHAQLKNKNKCSSCEYKRIKQTKLNYQHFLTNYAYYLTSTLYDVSGAIDNRLITIFDEAHGINEIFCNFIELKISVFVIKKIIRMLKEETWGINSKELSGFNTLKSLIISGKVTEDNYLSFLKNFFNFMSALATKYANLVETSIENKDYTSYIYYNKKHNYIKNYLQKYYDFLSYKYKHVIDITTDYINISPIFIENMFSKIKTSKYCLFMSATIDANFIKTTLKLDPDKLKYIHSDPVFSPNTKEIVFINHNTYNYKSLKNESVLKEMNFVIKEIVKLNKNKRGIILTPSFYINSIISRALKQNININLNILEHERGEKLENILKIFLTSNKNSILISPSLFEGIDLPDKLSEYQIMIKAPYLNLSDKRIKYIFDNYKEIYKTYALYRIIQGFGRSTRHENDYSITYCLDTNIRWLFYSKTNFWKNEFNIKHG